MAELLLLCFLGPPLIIIGAACAPFIFILGVLAAGVAITGLAFYVLMRVVLALVLYAYPCPLHSTLWECNREPLAVALTAGGDAARCSGSHRAECPDRVDPEQGR